MSISRALEVQAKVTPRYGSVAIISGNAKNFSVLHGIMESGKQNLGLN
jgi:ribonuclease PH